MINSFESFVIHENMGWFFSYEMNGLFNVEMDKNKCNLVQSIKCEAEESTRLFSGIAIVKNKLVLVPMVADKIAVYDIALKRIKMIDIPTTKLNYKENAKFFAAISYNQFVFIVGHSFPAIIRLNIETDDILILTDWCYMFHKELKEGKDLFRNNYCVRGNKFLIACCQKNMVLEVNMDSGVSKYIEVGSADNKYSGIAFDGKDYWLTSLYKHFVVRWNYESGLYKEIQFEDHNDMDLKYNMRYSQAFCVGKYIVVLPLYSYSTTIIDTENEKFTFISSDWVIKNEVVPVAPIRGGFVYKKDLYVSCSVDGGIYRLDIQNKKYVKTNLDIRYALEKVSGGNCPKAFRDMFEYESTEKNLETLILFVKTYK